MQTQVISTLLLLSSLLPIIYLTIAYRKVKQSSQDPAGFQVYALLRFRWQLLGSSFILWLAGLTACYLNESPLAWLHILSGVTFLFLAVSAVYVANCTTFPAVDAARFLAPGEVSSHLSPDDPVIGLEINGDAHAYPIKSMENLLIVQDVIGGTPVLVTYCVPCKKAGAFPTGIEIDSLRLVFPPRREHKVMIYDSKTKRLIKQKTGEIIFGPDKGKKLPVIPVRIVPWVTWVTIHPQSKVFYHRSSTASAEKPAGINRFKALVNNKENALINTPAKL